MSFFKKKELYTVKDCKKKRRKAILVIVLHVAFFVLGFIARYATRDTHPIEDLLDMLVVPCAFAALPLFFVIYSISRTTERFTFEELMFWGCVYSLATPSQRRAMDEGTIFYVMISFILKLLLFGIVMFFVCIPWMVIRIIYAIISLVECHKFMKKQKEVQSM